MLVPALLRLFGWKPDVTPPEKRATPRQLPALQLAPVSRLVDTAPHSPQLPVRKAPARTPRSAPPPFYAGAKSRPTDAVENELHSIVSSLLRRFESEQTVVMGTCSSKISLRKDDTLVYVVGEERQESTDADYIHVAASSPSEWPHALALAGFDWRTPSTWFLGFEQVDEPRLTRHLKAVATLAAPSSVVVLVSLKPLAEHIAHATGFTTRQTDCKQTVFVLDRNQRGVHPSDVLSTCISPATSVSSVSTLSDAACFVRFSLEKSSVPAPILGRMAAGSLRVVGEKKQLGVWHPDKGVGMIDAGDVFVVELLLSSVPSDYKYVFVGEDGFEEWEAGDNRSLPKPSDRFLSVEDAWKVQ